MTITLLDARTFCRETVSPDSSGEAAERQFMVWINAARRRLAADCDWEILLDHEHVMLNVEESGSEMSTTQGSLQIALGGAETFDSKYVTEEWDLQIGSEYNQTFRLASVDTSTTATMVVGDEWILSSGSSLAWKAVRTRYPLGARDDLDSGDPVDIKSVRLLQDKSELCYYAPHEFDLYKMDNVASIGAYPRAYTFRNGQLEVWPHPGSSYVKLGVSYRRTLDTLADDALDTVVLKWEPEWRDLLFKAIMLEGALHQGENAPIPYPLAKLEYEERLSQYKALDLTKGQPKTGFKLQHPKRHRGTRYYSSDNRVI